MHVHVQSAKVHIEPFNGKLQYVPKNLFPKWHSVGNTVRLQRSETCRYLSYDQRAPRHSCHHKMKTMHQRPSATRIPAPGRNCRNGQGIIFYCLCMVVATLTVGSPSTSKYLIMLTCPIKSAQHSAMGRTKWAATYIQYFALGIQLPPSSNKAIKV